MLMLCLSKTSLNSTKVTSHLIKHLLLRLPYLWSCGYIDAALENLLKFGFVSDGDVEELTTTFLNLRARSLATI